MALSKAYYCSRVAFTLLELLVGIVVLTILLLLLNQLFGEASLITNLNYKQMESDAEARLVFDRMGEDLVGMLRRTDIDYLFVKNSGSATAGANDGFFMYSQAPAYFDTSLSSSSVDPRSPLSLLGYRVNSSSYQLERLGKGLTWDNQGSASTATASYNSIIFLAPSTGTSGGWNPNTLLSGAFPSTVGTPGNNYNATEPDYQVIAPDAFRLEISYLLTDGTVSDIPILSTTPAGWTTNSSTIGATFSNSSSSCPVSSNGFPTYAAGSRWYVAGTTSSEPQCFICTSAPSSGSNTTWQSLGMKDVSAVIVTMAVLDGNSRKLLGATSVGSLIPLFLDSGFTTAQTASSVTLPGAVWQAKLNSSSPTFGSTAHIPQAAAAQIRVYQRFFYLNPQP